MRIREITESDAEDFLRLNKTLDEETSFMMLEPGERTTTVEEQRERIQNVLSLSNHTILVAEDDGLVGYVAAIGGSYKRNMHAAHVVIGILRSHAGRGVGNMLMIELEKWAFNNGIHRL